MNTLPLVSVVAGTALLCAPAAVRPLQTPHPATPAEAMLAPPHPHHAKVTVIPCVKGKVQLAWFTVPYNPKHLEALKPGYEWGRGFTLTNDIDFMVGQQKVPAGAYAVSFQLDDKGKDWSWVLKPSELMQLNMQIQRARRAGQDTAELEKKLAEFGKKGMQTMKLDSKSFAGTQAEHMEITAINHGYRVVKRGDTTPTSGVEAEVQVSWGDLHTSFAFTEVFEAPKNTGQGAEQPRRRRR